MWNQHQSSTCPTWRRCQRCRERGHDEPQCDSKLRNFPSEVPCEYCGNEHLESECDHLWKSPSRETHSEQVTVSICCANCCSMKHLAGDCETSGRRRNVTLSSSSFTLKGIDQDMITNLNFVGASRNGPPSSRGRPGPRGRRDWSPPSSPDDEDMMSRVSRGNGRPPPAPRGNARGNIKFANGIANNRGDSRSRGPSRGRPPFSGNGNGQRSLDPPLPRGPPPPRGGGRGRGPSRGPSRGGFSRGTRGPGRGRGRG
jgi:protein AIR1/2